MEKKNTIGFLLLLLLVIAAHTFLQEQLNAIHREAVKNSEKLIPSITEQVSRTLKAREQLGQNHLAYIFSLDPQIAYIIIDDRTMGARVSGVNPRALRAAPTATSKRLLLGEFHTLATELMQVNQGGATPGFDVMQIELVDRASPKLGAQAVVKLGYVVNRFVAYQHALWGVQLILLIQFIVGLQMLISARLNRRISRRLSNGLALTKEEIDLFSPSKNRDEDTEIVLLTQPKHLQSEKWQPLLDHRLGLENWQKRGGWFLINDYIFANPWCASLVRNDIHFKDYVYRLKAKSILGQDGFMVLFACDGKNLVWVLGGWGNSRSEVAGIEKTRRKNGIDQGKWYEVTIEVLPQEVRGYLNGDQQWSLSRAEIHAKDFSKEFLPGIGMASWSSVCKFRDPLIVDKTDAA